MVQRIIGAGGADLIGREVEDAAGTLVGTIADAKNATGSWRAGPSDWEYKVNGAAPIPPIKGDNAGYNVRPPKVNVINAAAHVVWSKKAGDNHQIDIGAWDGWKEVHVGRHAKTERGFHVKFDMGADWVQAVFDSKGGFERLSGSRHTRRALIAGKLGGRPNGGK